MSNKEELNVAAHSMENFKEFKELEKPTMPNCEACGKSIRNTKWNKQYHHINISQEPKERFFCSRQCKLRWIFDNF